MSFLPDLTPLTNEIKVFSSQLKELNTNQLRTNQLLTEILQEIQSSKRILLLAERTSIVEDKLRKK